MKKQSGISAVKLVLCIAIGILTAGAIGSIISYIAGAALIKGIMEEFSMQTPKTQVLKPTLTTFNNNQFYKPLPQQPTQQQIHRYPVPTTDNQIVKNNPSQNFIEFKGKRTYYGQANKNTQNKPNQPIFTGNQFIDKTVNQSQQIIQNMGKDMIKNMERAQRQPTRKIQYIEPPHPKLEELTQQDVENYRKDATR